MTPEKNVDERALRRCLGQFGTGVTIITTEKDGVRAGVTANSFSSISLDPPLVGWSLKRTSRSFEAFKAATHFTVNILSSDQIEVSQVFSGPDTDKFAKVNWTPGITGTPVIPGAIGIFECKVDTIHEAGDHLIFIGEVQRFEHNQGDALLFSQGRYAVAMDHPKLKPAADLSPKSEGDEAASFWRMMFLAQHRMSRRFDRHREQEGFTAAQTRVLMTVFDRPGGTMDEMINAAVLPSLIADDAVNSLADRGLLVRGSDGKLTLTNEGVARRKVMADHWAQFEANELRGIDPADIANARKVLEKLLAA